MCFRITRCCCFTNTKDGSFAVGIYTSTLRVISIIVSAVLLVQFEYVVRYDYYDRYFPTNLTENAIRTILIILLVTGVICLLVSFLLLYGAKKDDRFYLIPWMASMPFGIIGQILVIIFLIIDIASDAYFTAFYAIGTVILGLCTAFDIYCYSCVYSQYKTLNERIDVGIQMQENI